VSGANTVSLAIFAAVLPARASTGALLPILIAGDVLAVLTYRRHAHWPTLWRLFPAVAVGVVAGAAAGKGVAERIDPTGEAEYWREEYRNRDYVKSDYDYERDYAAAYGLGLQAREQYPTRSWEESETELSRDWGTRRGDSRLEWEDARLAARDSWQRADTTYRTYEDSDRYYAERFDSVDYRDADAGYDDYRPAYRYGVQARSRHQGRDWDERLETDLESGWERAKDRSRLTWAQAKAAVREAFHSDRYPGSGRGTPPDPRV
jgi:hypothetical protein